MNKEQALKLLLDTIEQDSRFSFFEYEALFKEEKGSIRLDSDITIYQDGKALFALSSTEIQRHPGEPILDTLVKRFYNILSVEMIELKNTLTEIEELDKKLSLKEGRLKRQGKRPHVTDKQRKPLVKEVEKLKEKREGLLEKTEQLYKVNPQLQLLRNFESLLTFSE